MHRIYRQLQNWTKAAARSVAFLPLPMMVIGLMIGVGLFYFETDTNMSREITSTFPSLAITSQDSARNILGLFIGGLMTLMVFTFTQMMSLFNQVASSYSPRLLPRFTGDRSLQFSMGFYIGTIVMSLIVLMSIRSDEDGYVPNVSVLLCIISGIVALMIFIYFVTTISSKIQAGNIIADVYNSGVSYLENGEDREHYSERYPTPDTSNWYTITSPIDGFLGSVDHHRLGVLAKKYKTRFYIGTFKGEYVPKSFPLIESEKKLDGKQLKLVLEAVSPIKSKFDDWYLPQLELLVEIAMKAMSPGINDPGTALGSIDKINGLLGHLMFIPMYNFFQDEDGGEVWFSRKDYSTILSDTFSQLRNYSRGDVMVMRGLLKMGFQLLEATGHSKGLNDIINQEIEAVINDARHHISNDHDRHLIAKDVHYWRKETKEMLTNLSYLGSPEPYEKGIPID